MNVTSNEKIVGCRILVDLFLDPESERLDHLHEHRHIARAVN